MKIETSAKEVMNVFEGLGISEEAKKKLSGTLLSVITSEEMLQIVDQMAKERVDKRLEKILDEFLVIKPPSYYSSSNKYEVKGWGTEMLQTRVKEAIAAEGDLKDLLRKLAREEYSGNKQYLEDRLKEIDDRMNQMVEVKIQRIFNEVLGQEILKQVEQALATDEFKQMIRKSVRKSLQNMMDTED